MTKFKKPPIEPTYSDKVVSLAGFVIKNGKTNRCNIGSCRHLNLVKDDDERSIYCEDCKTHIDPYDALISLFEWHHRTELDLKNKLKEADDAMTNTLVSRASKAWDKIWRSRYANPTCPHCNRGISPEDALNSRGSLAARSRKN